jgi:hypothetical protein
MKHLLISIFFTLLFSSIPIEDSTPWNILQEGDINISYYWDKFPWCKATIEIDSSIDDILKHIENINNYENIFDTVSSSKEYDNNVVHIVLDIPSLFADRDYVVKFVKYNEGDYVVYEFNSISNNNIKLDENYVRLLNAAGQWRLKSINNKLTKVTYIWNGEMLGSFPSWGLKRAWSKQGNEVLKNLKETLKNSGS